MDEEIDGINVVPLVDVMLVLLTIVLTTATFIATGRVPVDLAAAKNASTSLERPVFVTLTLHHAIYVDDVPAPDLAQALSGTARTSQIVVRADGGLPLREFIDLTDRIKGMGFERVALEVRRS